MISFYIKKRRFSNKTVKDALILWYCHHIDNEEFMLASDEDLFMVQISALAERHYNLYFDRNERIPFYDQAVQFLNFLEEVGVIRKLKIPAIT